MPASCCAVSQLRQSSVTCSSSDTAVVVQISPWHWHNHKSRGVVRNFGARENTSDPKPTLHIFLDILCISGPSHAFNNNYSYFEICRSFILWERMQNCCSNTCSEMYFNEHPRLFSSRQEGTIHTDPLVFEQWLLRTHFGNRCSFSSSARGLTT